MSNLINLEKFFIISQEQFDNLITTLNLGLSKLDPVYMITYIIANAYAIFIIVLIVIFIFKGINILLGGRIARDIMG